MDEDWIKQLFSQHDLTRMGHAQRKDDLNLGLGWLYYAITRIYKPTTCVCIGSWRGFVPMLLAKGVTDNIEEGNVTFIDPSMADDFWKDSEKNDEWFGSFGLNNIEHHLHTTQDFVNTEMYKKLDSIDILFVDGYHTRDQAKFDFEAFEPKLSENAIVFFHDSVKKKPSRIYGKDNVYQYSVVDYIDELKQRQDLQVFDFPVLNGVTIVRKLPM